MIFGEALRAARRQAGMSQRDLADRAGVDFSYISKMENGRIPPPSGDTIVRLCTIVGVPPESLLSLVGKMPSDVQRTISSSAAAQEFLREAQRIGVTEEEWRSLSKELRGLRGD
jgi:transcriptional regulator with XRE-family HTH domain